MSAAWKRGGDLAQKRGTESWRRAQDSANALGTESARCPWRIGDNPSIRPAGAGTRGRWLQFRETATRLARPPTSAVPFLLLGQPLDPDISGLVESQGSRGRAALAARPWVA